MPQEPTRKPSVESKAPSPRVSMGTRLQKMLKDVKPFRKHEEDSMTIAGDRSSGGWMDREDAARHALVSGDIARRTNPTVAKIGMGLYELITGNPFDKDAKMDFHNNAVGAELGKDAKSYEELKQKVKLAVDEATFDNFEDKGRLTFLKF